MVLFWYISMQLISSAWYCFSKSLTLLYMNSVLYVSRESFWQFEYKFFPEHLRWSTSKYESLTTNMNSSTSLLQVFSKQVRKYHLEEISIDINLVNYPRAYCLHCSLKQVLFLAEFLLAKQFCNSLKHQIRQSKHQFCRKLDTSNHFMWLFLPGGLYKLWS